VLALERSIAVTDDFDSVPVIYDFADLPADVRFNDGAVAPDGAFWAGTLSHHRDAAGALYRVGPFHRVSTVLDGVSISNGMDWAPGTGAHLYVDSGPGTIDVLTTELDRDDWAHLVDQQPFFRAAEGQGSPAGLTIDSEGFAWVALWGGGRVVRISPDGEVTAEVRVPAPHTSSVAFGGSDLRDLYITTAREDLSREQLDEFPLSGSVFRWRSDVPGRLSSEWLG
jgi:sugar lactone lactonase YvrE